MSSEIPLIDFKREALLDMEGWAATTSVFYGVYGAPGGQYYGEDPNWTPAWQLRWQGFLYYDATGQAWINYIFHATSTGFPGIRYLTYFDVNTGTYIPWVAL